MNPLLHVVPEQADIERNKVAEPEGERIRQELIDFLERNKICSMMLDTPHHQVRVEYAPKLPAEIKPVLRLWGSIFIVVRP